MKTYIAVFTLLPYSSLTKFGFKRIKDAEKYIKLTNRKTLKATRSDWLVVDNKRLNKHLDYLEHAQQYFY
jgi:hypothetical protein